MIFFIIVFALAVLCGCSNNDNYRSSTTAAEESEEIFDSANIEYDSIVDV